MAVFTDGAAKVVAPSLFLAVFADGEAATRGIS